MPASPGAAPFDWPYESTTPDSSTFEISDGSTTMTLVAWRPFTVRSFELVSHPDLRLRATDQVTARTSFADDGPLHSWAFVRGQRDPAVLFDLDAPEGLVMDGPELRFTIPAIPPGPLQLWIEGVPTVRFDRCDAPRGCEVESMARAMLDVTIVP